jgi:hypothetical protein
MCEAGTLSQENPRQMTQSVTGHQNVVFYEALELPGTGTLKAHLLKRVHWKL